jgi:hypothetical protein
MGSVYASWGLLKQPDKPKVTKQDLLPQNHLVRGQPGRSPRQTGQLGFANTALPVFHCHLTCSTLV